MKITHMQLFYIINFVAIYILNQDFIKAQFYINKKEPSSKNMQKTSIILRFNVYCTFIFSIKMIIKVEEFFDQSKKQLIEMVSNIFQAILI